MASMYFILWDDPIGLPAENTSKTNNCQKKWQWKHFNNEKSVKIAGLSIDWKREISTCDKTYYKHQQELFIDFYNHNLYQERNM